MTAEVQALVSRMEIENSGEDSGFSYWSGLLYGKHCVVARSGMGKVAAAACAQRLLDRWQVKCIVVCGLAGGLASELRRGDIVVGDGYLQHDVDATPIFPKFELPGTGLSVIPSPTEITKAALAASQAFLANGLHRVIGESKLQAFGIGEVKTLTGLIVTGDQFVKDTQREEIRANLPDAKCVEMEGAAIAQVCYLNQVDFVVVRIISDKADENAAADFNHFVEEIAPQYVLGILDELLPML